MFVPIVHRRIDIQGGENVVLLAAFVQGRIQS